MKYLIIVLIVLFSALIFYMQISMAVFVHNGNQIMADYHYCQDQWDCYGEHDHVRMGESNGESFCDCYNSETETFKSEPGGQGMNTFEIAFMISVIGTILLILWLAYDIYKWNKEQQK